MDVQDLDLRPGVAGDRIYVSWTEYWGLERYVDHYITSRNQRVNDDLRWKIRKCMAKYPGRGPLKKADMDYFLDANAPARGSRPESRST